MNNPKQEERFNSLLYQVRTELDAALANRAKIDEAIVQGKAMLRALEDIEAAGKARDA